MIIPESSAPPPALDPGQDLHQLIRELYPLCRSITGDGTRATLAGIAERLPLSIHEVPTGTAVFDWNVPREWNIRDAYVKNSRGERLIDFRASNLHVLNYSVPVHRRMRLDELRPHLFSLPEHPDWVPYRTSYYHERWGFCVSDRVLSSLPDDDYEVCIDSSLADGALTYGEYVHRGATDDTVLISCHICHPSLCNDNLSGIAVATGLAQMLHAQATRYSYRFVFIPATIGAITWLARNQATLGTIKHGLVLTCVGDPGPMTYKRSRRGDAEIDRAAAHVLRHASPAGTVVDFSPYGYDERQYCSPGFDLPVGCLMRTPHGRFAEYHTSADNPDFVRPEALADSLRQALAITRILERNRTYSNLHPFGEPQLGKRGLYRTMGGQAGEVNELAVLWVLNQSDGEHSLLDIAERSGMAFDLIASAADTLHQIGLLADHTLEVR